MDQLPFKPAGDVIGCFEFYNMEDLSDHQSLFFEKFVNRVGFQLHSKLLRRKGQEHLVKMEQKIRPLEPITISLMVSLRCTAQSMLSMPKNQTPQKRI